MQAKPTNEFNGNMAIADNNDTKVFSIVRGSGYAEKVAGWLWLGWTVLGIT